MTTITIRFPDGSKKEYEQGSTPLDIAKSISDGLARAVIAAKFNGGLIDLTTPLDEDGELVLLKPEDPSCGTAAPTS